ncbi:MAG: alpha/beta hydrolase family protein [Eubacteriales bacterium]|nr:alpha/beta hydrolase family protein [Eubacteriales bacterium]
MYWNDFHFYSTALGIQTAAYVLLPDQQVMSQNNGSLLPTLYLLHGLSDDYTMWLRQTRIEQYARKYRVAVVMPAVNRSFYTDMACGAKYFSFISEELPKLMETYFPLSKKREDRFAAGLSMGGYGAMKLGLRCPRRYGAVASLSGALEMEKTYDPSTRQDPAFLRECDAIFGGEKALKAGKDNLSRLALQLSKTPDKAPRIYVACGTADFLYAANNSFIANFGKALSMEYHTEEGAAHTWDFWDRQIEKVLEWLQLPAAENVW